MGVYMQLRGMAGEASSQGSHMTNLAKRCSLFCCRGNLINLVIWHWTAHLLRFPLSQSQPVHNLVHWWSPNLLQFHLYQTINLGNSFHFHVYAIQQINIIMGIFMIVNSVSKADNYAICTLHCNWWSTDNYYRKLMQEEHAPLVSESLLQLLLSASFPKPLYWLHPF